jgi:signal transduction histidine kinase
MQFEARRQRRDGTIVDVAISLFPIRDAHGCMIGVSSIARDITARKQADAALRDALEAAHAATRAKSLFLAMMSHELRTPLQAVLGYADLLLADSVRSFSPEQAEDILAIHRGAARMVALIEQLLDLSRMEAGRLQLETKPVNLTEILEHVRQDIAPQATAKALALTISLPATLPVVLGDADRLRQILLNLVGNAVKFTEQGGVRITARATEDGITVVVRDTGIGISEVALPFIFEEFRQVDGSITRRFGGAGLGLAIAKQLAEQMGGGISVESKVGVGSTFSLWLPVVPPTRPSFHRRRSPDTPRAVGRDTSG